MTYLSHILINPARAQSRDLLADPDAMRGAVIGGIPDPSQLNRVLWRLDADNPRWPLLFVLSPCRPDWSRLVEAAGWPWAAGDKVETRDCRPLLTRLAVGREFAFRVTANPVRDDPRAPAAGRAAAHRIPHRTSARQLGWFLEHAPAWGFTVPAARTGPAAAGPPGSAPDVRIIARHRHIVTEGVRGTPVPLHTATFEGRLLVTDVVLLTQAILRGLGPGRAYGCGLLTLAPPRPESPCGAVGHDALPGRTGATMSQVEK